MDDISMTALEKLMTRLDDEPSIVLKAALSALKRKGGTRKDWAEREDDEEEGFNGKLAEVLISLQNAGDKVANKSND